MLLKRNNYFLATLLIVALISSCTKTNDVDIREQMLGSWTTDETSKIGGKATYVINISKDATSTNGIIIKNFYQLGNLTNTIAEVDGSNITINQQTVSGYVISGSGSYSSGVINFSFTANDGQKTDEVTARCHQ